MGETRAFLLAMALLACSEGEQPAAPSGSGSTQVGGGGGAGGEAAAAGGAGGAAVGGGGAGCEVNEVPLFVTADGDVPSRIHVPVTYQGADALVLLDTGSSLTFLRLGQDDPDFVPDAGELGIGCATLTVPGRGGLAPHEDEFGLPVVGTMGADFLIGGATLLDSKAERLVRHPSGTELPEAAGWVELAYDDVQGHVLAPVILDGTPVRLMVDTGAPHILWLGEEGQPGDIEVTTTDAEGTEIILYYGSVEMELAARAAADVPVLRAPSFPYFEMTVAALGGNLHGLLGLSALRGRAVVFDGAAGALLLGPVP